jgi:hypothetical protein
VQQYFFEVNTAYCGNIIKGNITKQYSETAPREMMVSNQRAKTSPSQRRKNYLYMLRRPKICMLVW